MLRAALCFASCAALAAGCGLTLAFGRRLHLARRRFGRRLPRLDPGLGDEAEHQTARDERLEQWRAAGFEAARQVHAESWRMLDGKVGDAAGIVLATRHCVVLHGMAVAGECKAVKCLLVENLRQPEADRREEVQQE